MGLIFETKRDKFKFQRSHFGRLCNPQVTEFNEKSDFKLVVKIQEYLLDNSIIFEKSVIYLPSFSNSYVQATKNIEEITIKKMSVFILNSLFSKSEISGIMIPKDLIARISITFSSLFSFPSCEVFQLKIWNTLKFTNEYTREIRKAIKKDQDSKNLIV